MADEYTFDQFIRTQGQQLRAKDTPPATRADWDARRSALRQKLAQAIGPEPAKPCPLEPRTLGVLDRDGYRIEKLVFQSRPDVWVTANAYVPARTGDRKVPAVLVVHGHWAGARRDPVVQARCLGLVKLGFFVLAVDAFGAGERHTRPARGTYHGALYGSTLWPTGHTLLGLQVYDNRRAVDYLLSRPEVTDKIGITGASGGGNQSMNAGALDDRLTAVVPVCSVGNYQAYLRAACCVCEVLPNALTFTEEGDVLGLVAPRALLVINAVRDAIQFSPAEAEKSLARATDVYKLLGVADRVRHLVIDSGHDYNRAMREAMYGWMTRHLKGEGTGEPIPEPAHTVETPDDLACYPDPADRPKGFVTVPQFAGQAGRELAAAADKLIPDHPEMWQATGLGLTARLLKVLGPVPLPTEATYTLGMTGADDTRAVTATVEPGIRLPGQLHVPMQKGDRPGAVVLHLDGAEAARQHALHAHLVRAGYRVLTADLRATGTLKTRAGAIAGAPDHTPAEHGLWTGRPLLGQWIADTLALLHVLRAEPGGTGKHLVVGIGPASLVALVSSAWVEDGPTGVVAIDGPATLVTDAPYGTGTPMGLLVPGLLTAGDVPHLAGLSAPRRLVIAGGQTPQGRKLTAKELAEAYRFTTGVYQASKAADWLTITAEPDWTKIEW